MKTNINAYEIVYFNDIYGSQILAYLIWLLDFQIISNIFDNFQIRIKISNSNAVVR